jgi:hypothetical protein
MIIIHFLSYLAQFFLEWEMFQTKVVEKIKTHFMLDPPPPKKNNSCPLWGNVDKYGTARQAADDMIIRPTCFACWISKATDTYSEYVTLTAFPRQQWLSERASVLRLYAHWLSFFYTLLQRIFERLQVRQGMLHGSFRLCPYCSLEVAKDTPLNYHIAWQKSSDTTTKINCVWIDCATFPDIQVRLYIVIGVFISLTWDWDDEQWGNKDR